MANEEPALDKTRIRLTRLARLAADRLRLLPGDVRLIGWTDQRLPGMRIRPEAPQNRTYTLVLAHLARGHAAAAHSPTATWPKIIIDPTILRTRAERRRDAIRWASTTTDQTDPALNPEP